MSAQPDENLDLSFNAWSLPDARHAEPVVPESGYPWQSQPSPASFATPVMPVTAPARPAQVGALVALVSGSLVIVAAAMALGAVAARVSPAWPIIAFAVGLAVLLTRRASPWWLALPCLGALLGGLGMAVGLGLRMVPHGLPALHTAIAVPLIPGLAGLAIGAFAAGTSRKLGDGSVWLVGTAATVVAGAATLVALHVPPLGMLIAAGLGILFLGMLLSECVYRQRNGDLAATNLVGTLPIAVAGALCLRVYAWNWNGEMSDGVRTGFDLLSILDLFS